MSKRKQNPATFSIFSLKNPCFLQSPEVFISLQKTSWRTDRSVLQWNQSKKEAMFMTVTVDTTRCIGCGMCEYTAPVCFEL
jgi:Pyruvate/2-oxoacid:ferredoxin oxidoreductase delta subunit